MNQKGKKLMREAFFAKCEQYCAVEKFKKEKGAMAKLKAMIASGKIKFKEKTNDK